MKEQKQDNELKTIHDSWLAHPITKAAFGVIENHQQRFLKHATLSTSNSEVTDAQIRLDIMAVHTCSAIVYLLSDKNNFQLTPNELNNL